MWLIISYILSICTTCVYTLTAGNVKQNTVLPLPIKINGITQDTYIALDSNWRWIHKKGSYENCFTNEWVKEFCPDSETCSNNCEIEGISLEEWNTPYGVSVNGNSLTLQYVTDGPYGTNVGSRMYLLDSSKKYIGFDLRNKEFIFTVDVSQIPCGLNGAVYFTEMPLQNPYLGIDHSYGVNYGDAQCPKDIKYIEGKANVASLGRPLYGACSNEYDVWEANSRSTSIALHPCSIVGVKSCTNSLDCGDGNNRFKGICDKNGANYNLNREGRRTVYGLGNTFEINTMKPITVRTQFITDSNNNIIKVKQFLEQGKKIVVGAELDDTIIYSQSKKYNEPDHFHDLGGFKTMTDSLSRKHVLILSLWDDSNVNMRWLDSIYPVGSTRPEDYRGPCSTEDTNILTLRKKFPKSRVIYSNIQINDMKSTPPSTPPPTPTPTPTCASLYGQCGGKGWKGATCCEKGTCIVNNEWYSQCKLRSDTTGNMNGYWKCETCEMIQ